MLLDKIRGTAVIDKEAGKITQAIGSSEVPASVISKICKNILNKYNIEIKIPGLLFIDSPGHAAFTFLRKRGGSLADVAVLVIDVMEGIKPQTEESLNILKMYKTPFIIALNKIDKVSGWVANKNMPFLESYKKQRSSVQEELDTKIYNLIGKLYELGLEADRFDRVKDFTKQIVIIPLSALTGEGVAEVLTILTGVSQKYLEKRLEIDEKGEGKGTILEVKEVKGLGTTIDIILYDGILKKNDQLVIGNPEKIIETKIKAMLKTAPLKELRVEKQFAQVNEIGAAAGIKISAPSLENVIAGAPFIAIREGINTSKAKNEVKKEIERIEIKTEKEGVVIKADALGSLEALIKMLQEKGIPIKKAKIGLINKNDIVELENVDDKYKVIFAFNTSVLPEIEEIARGSGIKILKNNVIYKLIEDYELYVGEAEDRKKKEILQTITIPAKIKFLPQHIFRQTKPAIIGVEVLGGVLKQGVELMNETGKVIGDVHAIEDKGENLKEASIKMEVAVSISGATVDRNLRRGDILFTALTKDDYKKLKENENLLAPHEKVVLEEIKEIMKKKDPMWEFG